MGKDDGKKVAQKQDKKVRPKAPTSIAVGLKKGHVLKKIPKVHKRRVTGKRGKFIKEVISEVVGQAPYERRCIEYLRNSLDKRALKFAKRKLGTIRRAKKKVSDLSNVLVKMRQATN